MRNSDLKMTTDQVATELISSDLKELRDAAKKLANHAIKLASLGFGTSFLEWVASFAAIYLLILDRTNWKTNILTSLLIPYIFLSLPSLIFNIFRGQIGRWIAFIAVVLRLFFPRRFPEWLELPGALILLIVVAPSLIATDLRSSWVGVAICLAIGAYLLQEHIRASGGFRNSFTQPHGVSNTLGIIVLLVYPVWTLPLWYSTLSRYNEQHLEYLLAFICFSSVHLRKCNPVHESFIVVEFGKVIYVCSLLLLLHILFVIFVSSICLNPTNFLSLS